MKNLTLLFAFLGLFLTADLAAQSVKCCILENGECVACPAGTQCSAKDMASCTPAQKAACAKVKATCGKVAASCKPSAEKATAKTVANKKATATKKASCVPGPSCGKKVKTASCSPAKATSTALAVVEKEE